MTAMPPAAGDPMTAVLVQLAAFGEHLAGLDSREAGHYAALSDRVAELARLTAGLGAALDSQTAILAQLEARDEQVTALAARLGQDGKSGDHAGVHEPSPSPRRWKPGGQDREVVTRLRAWAEQVYRPGYGRLAAALPSCWEQHPLCLYALDILAELWSVLYLTSPRTPAIVSAQAEYQARILPAIAEQMMSEAARCGHAPARQTAGGQVRSTS
jgi:hypothetical protein